MTTFQPSDEKVNRINALLSNIFDTQWKKADYKDHRLPSPPTLEDIQSIVVSTPPDTERSAEALSLLSDESLDDSKHTFMQSKWTLYVYSLLFLNAQGKPNVEDVFRADEIWREAKGKAKEIGVRFDIEHPCAEVVKAWIKEQTTLRVTSKHDRRYPIAVLKHPAGSIRGITFGERDTGQVFQTPDRVDQVQLELDLGTEKSVLPAILPLQVVQTSHLKAQTKAGALSHEIRIFFEAMMALRPSQRRADLMFRLGDLIEYLYPNGKFNWTNQMPHIERALAVLHNSATIPWIDDQGSLRQWRPVSVRAPIPSDATRDTPVFLDVVMPPDAKRGYMLIKRIHRMVGMKSAAQWNTYHVACYLWDRYGTVKGKLVDPTRPIEIRDDQNRLTDASRKPLVTRNGKEIKSPYHTEAIAQLEREPNPDAIKRYPILSSEDLILACFPNGYPKKSRREYLSRAKEHWKALEVAGYILIHKERTGWRILPPEEHLNAHRALRKSAIGVY